MLDRLLREPTDNTLIQLFRYTFVGGFAFVVDFGSLYSLTEFAGFHYLVSAAVAFMLGLFVNYLLSVRWVFNSRTMSNRWLEFALFGLVGIVGLGLNELIIWFFTEQVGFHYMGSKVVSAIIVYLWNFFARKRLLFTREPTDP